MSERRRILLAIVVSACSLATACLPEKAQLLNRASDLFQHGQYEEAAAEYRRASALDASWSAPQLGLGNALRALGDRAGALSAYERAVELSPGSPDAQIALAGLLLEISRWTDSERQLQVALRELPNDGRLYAMLGFALFKQKRFIEALREFERSRELCERCMTNEEAAIFDTLKSQAK
jgi:tetratricopeptide (TPR) repeat protein